MPDVPSGFYVIGAAIVVAALLIPIRIATLGRSPRGRVGVLDRVLLVTAIVLGALFYAITVWFTVTSLRQKLVEGDYSIDLSIEGRSLTPPTSGTAHVSHVFVGEASANITHLSSTASALLITQHVLGLVVYTFIIGAGIYLCLRVFAGRPFARSMTVALWLCAFALVVVGSASDVVGEILRNRLTFEALGAGTPPAPYVGGGGFSFPGGYLLSGFAVAALAVAFGAGARVQRDADGLV